ncbi:receptor-like protein 3 [Rosa rugosa]|uniref:receptor-like protein 3 n=1 Tax=Rosa rugosa TaxID=74645 RepID=UPI002B415D67|nr:receptor-like protein 3 [Rosa rugosa]
MAHNSLYGVVDERIVNLTNLIILDLNSNQPSGNIPSNTGTPSSLKFMILHTNNLAGSLPQYLLNCTNLIELNLRFNNFEGVISMFNFSKFVHLSKIDLQRNYFTCIFPVSLYSCKSLRAIRLSFNDIEGQIQPEILSLKSLSFLSLGGTRLTNVTGAMKILMRCESFVALFFSYNFLGEEIPADGEMVEFNGFQNLQVLSISQLQFLRSLDPSFNNFSGDIPNQISNLINLERLDLSMNQLSGEIPTSITSLTFLASFNVSHNNLQGLIPKSTQLQGFDISAFEGNPKLCGAPLPMSAPERLVLMKMIRKPKTWRMNIIKFHGFMFLSVLGSFSDSGEFVVL